MVASTFCATRLTESGLLSKPVELPGYARDSTSRDPCIELSDVGINLLAMLRRAVPRHATPYH